MLTRLQFKSKAEYVYILKAKTDEKKSKEAKGTNKDDAPRKKNFVVLLCFMQICVH